MLYIPESDLVIFLCYPSVMNLDDLTRWVKNLMLLLLLSRNLAPSATCQESMRFLLADDYVTISKA
jgi:hypothetical protein